MIRFKRDWRPFYASQYSGVHFSSTYTEAISRKYLPLTYFLCCVLSFLPSLARVKKQNWKRLSTDRCYMLFAFSLRLRLRTQKANEIVK